MSTDARITILVVGIVLLAAALIGVLIAAANKRRSGHALRLLIGAVGAALIIWAVTLRPHAGRHSAPSAVVARTAPAAADSAGAGAGATGGAAANAPAGQAAAAPAAPAGQGAQAAPGGSAGAGGARPDVIFLAGAAFDGCPLPKRPATAPDGATATRAQMVASQRAVKAFDAAIDAYQGCLNTAAGNFVGQYGRVVTQASLQEVDALHTKLNNAAADTDQAVADQFNRQLRVFNARSQAYH
jgi:hypothetical protein